jgi:hypothetical protein
MDANFDKRKHLKTCRDSADEQGTRKDPEATN